MTSAAAANMTVLFLPAIKSPAIICKMGKVKFAAIMSMLALESEDTVNNNISLQIVEQRIKTIFN